MLRKLTIITLIAFTLALVGGCAKNPVTGQQELSFMSKQEEIDTGERFYPMMTQMNDGELQDPQLQQYVQNIGEQLASVSHRPDLPYKFNIVNASNVNAYALPGGFISVTRGLLLQMQSEDELAAVIGHEIAHATARHGAQGQTRSILTSIVLTAGQVYLQTQGVQHAGLYSDLGRVGASAILASYSRSQERQADRLGIQYMTKAGYNPRGMVDLQQILLQQRKRNPGMVEQLFASHPLSEERIKDSKTQIKQLDVKPQTGVDGPPGLFKQRVEKTWYPRKPAYEQMDSGVHHIKNERASKAEEHFRKAIDLYDREALFHTWLGRSLDEQGKHDEARTAFDRGINLHGDVFRVRLFSAINYFQREQHSKSLEELDRADQLIPDHPSVDFYRGRNHEEMGNRERAAKQYSNYLQKVNEGDNARYALQRLRRWGYVN